MWRERNTMFIMKIDWCMRWGQHSDTVMLCPDTSQIWLSVTVMILQHLKSKLNYVLWTRCETGLPLTSQLTRIYSTWHLYKTHQVNEIEPLSWTNLRLSWHLLAIEKGRWKRRGRGRLPLGETLCTSRLMQTETHVIVSCPISSQIRLFYNITAVNDLMINKSNCESVYII